MDFYMSLMHAWRIINSKRKMSLLARVGVQKGRRVLAHQEDLLEKKEELIESKVPANLNLKEFLLILVMTSRETTMQIKCFSQNNQTVIRICTSKTFSKIQNILTQRTLTLMTIVANEVLILSALEISHRVVSSPQSLVSPNP